MNYSELKEAVNHILREPCPACKAKYSEENIHILSTTQGEAVFYIACAKCPSKIIVNVKFRKLKNSKSLKSRKHRTLGIRRKTAEKITSNDYLDVRNFLKNFSGDFKDYFKQ